MCKEIVRRYPYKILLIYTLLSSHVRLKTNTKRQVFKITLASTRYQRNFSISNCDDQLHSWTELGADAIQRSFHWSISFIPIESRPSGICLELISCLRWHTLSRFTFDPYGDYSPKNNSVQMVCLSYYCFFVCLFRELRIFFYTNCLPGARSKP